MTSLHPRLVLVTRHTEFDSLLAFHGTRGQVAFFLESRGQDIADLEDRHRQQLTAVDAVKQSLPETWSLAEVRRDDLDRFLFTPNDVIVAIGQDGLVANLAKYVSDQPILGVTPDPERFEGVLTSLPANSLSALLPDVAAGGIALERRAMVEARLGDGQVLRALNELFIGHRSHQSARYVLRYAGSEEFQSSSGVIVATGTGLTGWAKSILTATHHQVAFAPTDKSAVYLAREPWPSRTSGCTLNVGELHGDASLTIGSRMNDGGVIFADGIEQDYLRFDWGLDVTISVSERTLNLVRAT
ncbi:MAG: hypothetical protein AAGL24_29030 [Pseudomonadota bacterium]